ncbi:hypothetical protein PENCOP_c008G07640 [Penicillium coprophilum]|uniref:Uncharacterized protein n=1 Tax=Penicillium coprophilum TaxID=36646 RepID=A0A1V6UJB9_9EURO|nr:hypothetical protein PENCOP_c008G07640 [Penicillium coprophilum]
MYALYRFQLCCNLFAQGHNGPILQRAPEYEARGAWKLLQLLFYPWEIEEIVCIHEFAMSTYQNLSPFDWNWDRLLPRQYHQQPVDSNQRLTDESKIYPSNSIIINRHVAVILLQQPAESDLGQSHMALSCYVISYYRRMRTLTQSGPVQKNDTDTMEQAFALRDALSEFIKERRYPEAPLYQTSMDAGCDLITFQGDVVEDSEWMYPPLGWPLTWDGAHIAGFHFWLKHQMVAWKYVMWDATRLISMGVKDMLDP